MQKNRSFKLASAIGETILGIPVLGGSIVLGLAWIPLFIMLALHIITLVFSVKENSDKYGSIVGIVTSSLGWIPFLGMVMHIASAILLWVSFSKKG